MIFALTLILSIAVADDCQVIRNQIAAAKPRSIVTVPPGDYYCDSPIVLDKDDLTLIGTAGQTVIHLTPKANSPVIVLGHINEPPSPVKNVNISGFVLDGNMNNQDMECWGGPCDSSGTAFIRNNGISVRNAHDCQIHNIRTHHNRSGGLVTEKGTRHLIVSGLEADHNYFDGMAGCETEESSFSILDLHHNHYAGISIDLNFNRNEIHLGTVWANGDVGIFARYSNGNLFHDLKIATSGNHGIYLAADVTEDKCPRDYLFQRVEITGNTGAGLWFENGFCKGTRFIEVNFKENRGGCYVIAPGADIKTDGFRCL